MGGSEGLCEREGGHGRVRECEGSLAGAREKWVGDAIVRADWLGWLGWELFWPVIAGMGAVGWESRR
jgi:hypothetical protein